MSEWRERGGGGEMRRQRRGGAAVQSRACFARVKVEEPCEGPCGTRDMETIAEDAESEYELGQYLTCYKSQLGRNTIFNENSFCLFYDRLSTSEFHF